MPSEFFRTAQAELEVSKAEVARAAETEGRRLDQALRGREERWSRTVESPGNAPSEYVKVMDVTLGPSRRGRPGLV